MGTGELVELVPTHPAEVAARIIAALEELTPDARRRVLAAAAAYYELDDTLSAHLPSTRM